MAFIKEGTCSSSIVISSSIYSCTNCDYTEIVKEDDGSGEKECPKCKSKMKLISSQVEVI